MARKDSKKQGSSDFIFFDPSTVKISNFQSENIDDNIKKQSEEGYIEIVGDIVDATISQLGFQNDSKKNIRKVLLIFFVILLSVQYVSLFVLLMFKGFIVNFYIDNSILLAFITSVFVETLGAVTIMISFAFASKQENQALKILHGAIERYQKFGNNENLNKSK